MQDRDHATEQGLWTRRSWLTAVGGSGLSWLTPLGEVLAESPRPTRAASPQSLIVLWLAGGPSQLETFDPHEKSPIAGGTRAMETRVPAIQLAEGMAATADQVDCMALVRNVVSKEGDHERASYYGKTGYRPNPAITHPSIGAVLCHQLPEQAWNGRRTEIPRHVSILSDQWPPRGGYLGNEYDPYLLGDPLHPLPDVQRRVEASRFDARLQDLQRMEAAYRARYQSRAQAPSLQHAMQVERAATMMTSDQLRAFDLSQTTATERAQFGDTPFGRGCLVAARLIELGVRCVEVTLSGWDSHIKNHEIHGTLRATLDPALGGLLKILRDRDLLDQTVVLCGGEFGRTPQINPAGGRDHWPHGFSVALAGGKLRRGIVHGSTDPAGGQVPYEQGVTVADIHATVLAALGLDPRYEIQTAIGRPMKLSDGKPIAPLLQS